MNRYFNTIKTVLKYVLAIYSLLLFSHINAANLSGIIKDKSGNPVVGANAQLFIVSNNALVQTGGIIKVLNDTFGLELTEEDKVDFNRVKKNLYDNQELMSYFNKENTKSNIQDKFNEEVDGEFLNFINTKLDFYNKMTDDKANSLFKNLLFQEIYNREVRGVRK